MASCGVVHSVCSQQCHTLLPALLLLQSYHHSSSPGSFPTSRTTLRDQIQTGASPPLPAVSVDFELTVDRAAPHTSTIPGACLLHLQLINPLIPSARRTTESPTFTPVEYLHRHSSATAAASPSPEVQGWGKGSCSQCRQPARGLPP